MLHITYSIYIYISHLANDKYILHIHIHMTFHILHITYTYYIYRYRMIQMHVATKDLNTCTYVYITCIYKVYTYIIQNDAHTYPLLCLISLLLKRSLFGGTTATVPKEDVWPLKMGSTTTAQQKNLSWMSWTWLSDSGQKITMKTSSDPHQLIFYLTHILTFYLAFYVTSCTGNWGPGVPTVLWRSRLRPWSALKSGSALRSGACSWRGGGQEAEAGKRGGQASSDKM